MTASLPHDLAARVRRLPLLVLTGSMPAEDLGRMAAAMEVDGGRIDVAGR
ncbi:MAG: hypothetical protein ACREMO_07190 [Gemmatimonadales bacterium]